MVWLGLFGVPTIFGNFHFFPNKWPCAQQDSIRLHSQVFDYLGGVCTFVGCTTQCGICVTSYSQRLLINSSTVPCSVYKMRYRIVPPVLIDVNWIWFITLGANKNGMSLFVSLMFVANFPMYLIGYISCLLFPFVWQKMFVLFPLIFVVLFPLATKLSPGDPASGTKTWPPITNLSNESSLKKWPEVGLF
jgi:hypothetical protein